MKVILVTFYSICHLYICYVLIGNLDNISFLTFDTYRVSEICIQIRTSENEYHKQSKGNINELP